MVDTHALNLPCGSNEPGIVKAGDGGSTKMVRIINADEKVGHGHVVAVMDQVRQVKGAFFGYCLQAAKILLGMLVVSHLAPVATTLFL